MLVVLQLLNHNYIVLINCCNEVLGIAAKACPHGLKHVVILAPHRLKNNSNSSYLRLNMQLLGTTVDIHKQQVIQQQILNEIILIESLLICHNQTADLKCSHLAQSIEVLPHT